MIRYMIVMLQTIFGRHQVKTLYWAQKKQLLMFPLKRSCIDGLLMFPILDNTEKGLEIMIRNRSAKCYENSSTALLCAHQIHLFFYFRVQGEDSCELVKLRI
jgi:hypothetical protein